MKKVRRKGWVSKAGISDAESVADHTFSMCAIGMLLADAAGLDTQKIMKMVVLHDLAESIIGDHTPGEISATKKKRLESAAMKEILSKLPDEIRAEYHAIWNEYVRGSSSASRFVHRIDKLEMALQAESYLKDGHSSEDLLAQFFNSAQAAIGRDQDLITEVLRSLRTKKRY